MSGWLQPSPAAHCCKQSFMEPSRHHQMQSSMCTWLKIFVLKAEEVCGHKEAECWCSSVCWGDCFSAQESLSFPALPVLFLLPLSLSLEMLSSSSHVLCHLIWYCHEGQFQNFYVKMMSFFLLSLIQQFVHKTAFYSSEATPFQLCQTAPKTYLCGTTAEI